MKIVIVDDDKVLREVLGAVCADNGHEVVAEFADGIGLLDYVTTNQPDVVCLDFNLPGEDGLQLLAQIEVLANHVDVVMISGTEDPEVKGRAADLGATGFIHKPFTNRLITQELRDIAETRRIAARAAETPVPESSEVEVEANAEARPDTAAAVAPAESLPETIAAVIPRSAVVVDDSGSMRLLLKGILEELGIKVLGTASTGKDGAAIVKRTHPALVCLDVDMPVMTGIEALPLVCAASPQSRVIMVTGNASRSIVEAAIAGGAKGYFLKPIRPAKVAEFIVKLFPR